MPLPNQYQKNLSKSRVFKSGTSRTVEFGSLHLKRACEKSRGLKFKDILSWRLDEVFAANAFMYSGNCSRGNNGV